MAKTNTTQALKKLFTDIRFSEIGVIISCILLVIQTCSLSGQVKLGNKTLETQLAKDRPFVTSEPHYVSQQGKIVMVEYLFSNYGAIPGEVVCSRSKIAISETTPVSRIQNKCDTTPRVIYPTSNRVKFSIIQMYLTDELTNDFANNKGRVDMAVCIVFKSINDKDDRTWVALSKHVFTKNKFRTVTTNELTVPPNHKTCDIELPRGQ